MDYIQFNQLTAVLDRLVGEVNQLHYELKVLRFTIQEKESKHSVCELCGRPMEVGR